MVDKFHIITVGEYNLYSKTGKLFSLKKHGINEKNIGDLVSAVEERLSGVESTANQENADKLYSKYRILELKTLSKALADIMFYENESNELKGILGKDLKEKRSKYYIDKVYELTQLKIEKIDDIKKLNNEIERRENKYIEIFKKEETVKEGVTFTQVMLKVFQLNGFDVDYKMILSDFFELKDMINGRPK